MHDGCIFSHFDSWSSKYIFWKVIIFLRRCSLYGTAKILFFSFYMAQKNSIHFCLFFFVSVEIHRNILRKGWRSQFLKAKMQYENINLLGIFWLVIFTPWNRRGIRNLIVVMPHLKEWGKGGRSETQNFK